MSNGVIPSGVEGSGGPGGAPPEPPDRPDPSTDARDDTRRWRRLYAFVILFLALQVILYYAFTKAFE